MVMKGKNISASKIKAHSNCPQQLWFRYIKEMEPTKAPKGYREVGSCVHEAIENTIKRANTVEVSSESELKQKIVSEYDMLSKLDYNFPDDMYDRGAKCCRVAATFLKRGPSEIESSEWNPEILSLEERVEFAIDNDEISTGVTAIMDVCTESEIWDWKTGSIRDDTDHEEKIQGSVYMAAYFHEYGNPPETIRFVYLKEGKVRTVDPSDENWQYMIREAKQLLESIETDSYKGQAGDLCYFCDYEFWCDTSPTGFGGVNPDDF